MFEVSIWTTCSTTTKYCVGKSSSRSCRRWGWLVSLSITWMVQQLARGREMVLPHLHQQQSASQRCWSKDCLIPTYRKDDHSQDKWWYSSRRYSLGHHRRVILYEEDPCRHVKRSSQSCHIERGLYRSPQHVARPGWNASERKEISTLITCSTRAPYTLWMNWQCDTSAVWPAANWFGLLARRRHWWHHSRLISSRPGGWS